VSGAGLSARAGASTTVYTAHHARTVMDENRRIPLGMWAKASVIRSARESLWRAAQPDKVRPMLPTHCAPANGYVLAQNADEDERTFVIVEIPVTWEDDREHGDQIGAPAALTPRPDRTRH
jgi:hypothetical protein